MEIGKAIRLKQFSTLVAKDTFCASACALAWLGGIKRFMEPGSRIGFHAAYVVKNGEARESGVGNALVGAYLGQLGLAGDAIAYITTAAPESMQWLSAADANQYGIEVAILPSDASANEQANQEQQTGQPTTRISMGIARDAKQCMCVVELDSELKVFFDDILDGNRWFN